MSPNGSIELYYKLVNMKLKILIFSGDLDSAVAFNGTRNWIDSLNLTELKNKKWIVENEVVGFITNYKELDFIIIKGAGHMVALDKPKEALILLNNFLSKK